MKRRAAASAIIMAMLALAGATAQGGTRTSFASAQPPPFDGEPSAITCSFRGSAQWYYNFWDHQPIELDVYSTGSGPCVLTDNDQGGTPRKIDKSATYTFFAEKVLPGSPFGPPGPIAGGLTIGIDNTALAWGAYTLTDPPETEGEIPFELATDVEGVVSATPPSTGNGIFTDHLFGKGDTWRPHPVAITMQAVWATYCPECPLFPTIIPILCMLPICSAEAPQTPAGVDPIGRLVRRASVSRGSR